MLSKPLGSQGSADLRFYDPQPGTTRSRKAMDTGPVCRMVCLFTTRLALLPNMLLCVEEMCVKFFKLITVVESQIFFNPSLQHVISLLPKVKW